VFCKIVKGEIPAEKVYEDEKVVAFKDINPQAPVHVLIVPREHRANLLEYGEGDEELWGTSWLWPPG
jgi:histidine triad (HIT) family protein